MSLFEQGFEIIDNFISISHADAIFAQLNELEHTFGSEFSHSASGVRNINKKLSSVTEFLHSTEFSIKTISLLPKNAMLVRAILFNKSPESNWFVTWHQDRTVAVSSHFHDEQWRAWSLKDQVLHVQPPEAVLANMVTIRVHLDAASTENGCLKIIPNSHKLGVISQQAIPDAVADAQIYCCEVNKYAALIMRPLLLHASSKSLVLEQRRVLHFEFSDWQLPAGVNWG
jgi:ectoine hydroxylase-related dioxygenase (phytanoyl-CoA dioxygenase family)